MIDKNLNYGYPVEQKRQAPDVPTGSPNASPPPAPRDREGFDFGAPANLGDTHYDPQLDTTYTYQEKSDGRGGSYSGWDITEGTGGTVTGGPALPSPLPRPDNPFLNPSPTPRPDNPFLNPDPPVGINPPPNPFQPGPPVGINPPININPPVGTNPPIGINPPAPLPRPDNPFLNPFPQLPTGGQGGRTYGTAPVFGGFNPGKNFPTDEFGNPLPVPFNNGGIAGLRR